MSEEVSMIPIVSNIQNLHNIDIERGNKVELSNNKKSYIRIIIDYIIFENYVSKKITNYFNRKHKETTELSLV